MQYTNFDEIPEPAISNLEIFAALKYLFFDRLHELNVDGVKVEDLGLKKFTLIAMFIQRITDANLLENTVEFLKRHQFQLQDTTPFLDELRSAGIYSEADLIKVSAHIYGLQLSGIVFGKLNDALNNELASFGSSTVPLPTKMPQLSINVSDRQIEDNEDEIQSLYRKKMVFAMKLYAESLNRKDGEMFLQRAIVSFAELDFIENTDFFKGEISFLSTVKENFQSFAAIKPEQLQTTPPLNPYPRTFSDDGYALWLHIKKFDIKDGHGGATDISYFYWRLYNHKNKYILVRPEEFRDWLRSQGIEIEKVKSFNQIPENINRDNKFRNALDWLKFDEN